MIVIFSISFLFCSCKKQVGPSLNANERAYLFLGHAYQWGVLDNNRVDYRLEKLDYAPYHQIWLGGDICSRTSENQSTLNYLNDLFDIDSPNTHWAIGNHDLINGSVAKISATTKRPDYYFTNFDGIGLLVLNTNFNHPQIQQSIDDCPEVDKQYALFESVTDTIKSLSHLVILHHHNLLTNQIANNKINIKDFFHYCDDNLAFRCEPKASFQELAYPKLVEVQNRGVQVVLVGGDFGMLAKIFEFKTKEGIYFLGSGINNSCDKNHAPSYVTNFDPDHVLVFIRDLSKKKLRWEFLELNGMIGK